MTKIFSFPTIQNTYLNELEYQAMPAKEQGIIQTINHYIRTTLLFFAPLFISNSKEKFEKLSERVKKVQDKLDSSSSGDLNLLRKAIRKVKKNTDQVFLEKNKKNSLIICEAIKDPIDFNPVPVLDNNATQDSTENNCNMNKDNQVTIGKETDSHRENRIGEEDQINAKNFNLDPTHAQTVVIKDATQSTSQDVVPHEHFVVEKSGENIDEEENDIDGIEVDESEGEDFSFLSDTFIELDATTEEKIVTNKTSKWTNVKVITGIQDVIKGTENFKKCRYISSCDNFTTAFLKMAAVASCVVILAGGAYYLMNAQPYESVKLIQPDLPPIQGCETNPYFSGTGEQMRAVYKVFRNRIPTLSDIRSNRLIAYEVKDALAKLTKQVAIPYSSNLVPIYSNTQLMVGHIFESATSFNKQIIMPLYAQGATSYLFDSVKYLTNQAVPSKTQLALPYIFNFTSA